MNAQDRIKKAHISIMRHKVFCAFSGVLACGKVEVNDTTPTACTNGWDVSYGTQFVDSLDDAELRFVVLHETIHKSYQHLNVWRNLWDENKQLANIACDHFVNLALVDTDNGEGFLKMPKVGIQPEPQFRGWSVKQIYDHLKQEQDEDDEQQGQGDGSGLDDHDFEGAGSSLLPSRPSKPTRYSVRCAKASRSPVPVAPARVAAPHSSATCSSRRSTGASNCATSCRPRALAVTSRRGLDLTDASSPTTSTSQVWRAPRLASSS
jgi:hypothetical protein